jgi:protein gp37
MWNKHFAAFQAKHGHRQRVFCASLSDVFDNQAPEGAREDLFELIAKTPELDWLLLTKRPENIIKMIADSAITEGRSEGVWSILPHVWIGTTAEDQTNYDRRWSILQEVPARVRFISYEPAIGPLTLANYKSKPDWLIAGGESGQGYRWDKSQWYYAIKHECEEAAIPFFMKQLAGRKPIPDDLLVRQFPSVGVTVKTKEANHE